MRALVVFISATMLLRSSVSLAVDPSDFRQPVNLTPKEYSWLLNEMRGHLDAIGAAQQAFSTGDVETARQALLERGTARQTASSMSCARTSRCAGLASELAASRRKAGS